MPKIFLKPDPWSMVGIQKVSTVVFPHLGEYNIASVISKTTEVTNDFEDHKQETDGETGNFNTEL